VYSWRVPLTLAGELKVAAYADLGGLGTKQGSPVAFVWKMPNLLPALLPWLVLLALLALPSNRSARAWWIWAPLAALALLGGWLGAAADALDNEAFGYSLHAAFAAAFGLAAVWLLGAGLARGWRVLGIVLTALSFAAVSLLAFVANPLWEQELELSFLLIFWLLSGVVFAGTLSLAGWMCRRRFSSIRVMLRLPFYLWGMWLVAGSLLAGVVTLVSGGGFDWPGFAVGSVVLALVSFGVILPFLILSFTCSFYRERLKSLLRLPAPAAVLAAATLPPLADRQVASA
jgi:hypothetical protein